MPISNPHPCYWHKLKTNTIQSLENAILSLEAPYRHMPICAHFMGFMLLSSHMGSEIPIFPNLNINSNPKIYLYQGIITLYTQFTSRT